MKWLACVFFLTTLSASAKDSFRPTPEEDCKSRDMISKLPPIRDQGPRIGWCYAVTGADLLTAASQLPKENAISLLDMGGTYISASSKTAIESLKFINQGENGEAIREAAEYFDEEFSGQSPSARRGGATELAMALYLSQNRICSEQMAPSQGRASESKGLTLSKSWKLHNETGEETMTFIEKEILERAGLSNSLEDHLEEPNSAVVHNCVAKSVPLLKPALVRAIYDFATKELKRNLNDSCQTAPPFPTKMKIELGSNEGKFSAKANELLNRDIPIGIGYDYCRLSKKRMPGPCPHESIVAGRRFFAGSCQYLIRNSHGPNCEIYQDMNVECDKEHPGYFWVDEKSLNSVVEDFTWVETDKKISSPTRTPPF